MRTESFIVLVVEDDAREREMAKTNFEALGYRVIATAGVDEAVELILKMPDQAPLLIYAKKEWLSNLYQAAAKDHLTGLDNFRTFEEKALELFQNAKARGEPAVLTLISTDVKKFKKFNNRFGKIVGNGVLKEVASVLKSNIRPTDIIGRHSAGADEFFILSSSLNNKEEALGFGQRLENAVRDRPWVVGLGPKGGVRFSIAIHWGVAQVRHDEIESPAKSLQDLIRLADTGPLGLIRRRGMRHRRKQ